MFFYHRKVTFLLQKNRWSAARKKFRIAAITSVSQNDPPQAEEKRMKSEFKNQMGDIFTNFPKTTGDENLHIKSRLRLKRKAGMAAALLAMGIVFSVGGCGEDTAAGEETHVSGTASSGWENPGVHQPNGENAGNTAVPEDATTETADADAETENSTAEPDITSEAAEVQGNGVETVETAGQTGDTTAETETAAEENMLGTGILSQENISHGESQPLGSMTYRMDEFYKTYTMEDGTEIYHVKIQYPVFLGGSQAEEKINAFYESWLDEFVKGKETPWEGGDSPVNAAAKLKQQTPDAFVSMGDEITASVMLQQGLINVLMDGYDFEGGAHGMPYRISNLFYAESGEKGLLSEVSALSKEELNQKMVDAFLQKYQQDGEDAYFPDALTVIQTLDVDTTGNYLAENGVVFFLRPYDVAPYAAGYVEVTIPYEEIFS